MTQEITVTKTEDHYEMQFEGNDTTYPVPTSAIDKLDDDLTPEETGDSVTFVGEYGGHKHMKNFDVEEVLDAPNDNQSDEEEVEQVEEESAGEEEEEVVEVADDEFTEADVGESGKCLHARCDDDADVAVKCDTGQIKHYCDKHNDGRRAGHALIVEEKRLTDETEENSNDGEDQDEEIVAEPTDEHVEEAGYHTAAGQAQQMEAQRLFGTEQDCDETTAQEPSESASGPGNTDSEKRTIADGGREEWLFYGQPADVIDEPEKVFARRNDEFVLMPMSLFDESVIEDNEHVPGEIFLDGISADDGYYDIVDQLEPVDVDDLITDLVEETVFSEREAQMVVLGGWFGMDREKIAEHLDLSKHTVRNHIEAAKTRYQKAKATKGNMFNL